MSETEKADIVERLRGYNPPDRTIDEQRQIAVDIQEAAAEIERLRSVEEDNKQGGEIIIELKQEVERLRALPSRSDVLEEAARVARETGAHFLTNRDAYVLHGPAAIVAGIVQAIRALKKDTDNG